MSKARAGLTRASTVLFQKLVPNCGPLLRQVSRVVFLADEDNIDLWSYSNIRILVRANGFSLRICIDIASDRNTAELTPVGLIRTPRVDWNFQLERSIRGSLGDTHCQTDEYKLEPRSSHVLQLGPLLETRDCPSMWDE